MSNKIACSKGHIYDLSTLRGRWEVKGKNIGDKCPMVMSYDRMFGTQYCNCLLKKLSNENTITHRGKPYKIPNNAIQKRR